MPKTVWKPKAGVTWRDKLEREHPSHGKIAAPTPALKKAGFRRVLIPRPLDVDAAIRRVRKGRLITTGALREQLASDAGADTSCPMTTGIFVRIVAEAAEENRLAGKKRISPYWRVVGNDGSLNAKFPGGAAAQAMKLREEGMRIARAKGKQPPKVIEFERLVSKPSGR